MTDTTRSRDSTTATASSLNCNLQHSSSSSYSPFFLKKVNDKNNNMPLPESLPHRRPAASAYADKHGWLKSGTVVLTTFLLIFILHNVLFRDYRGEMIHQLKANQLLSDEEIEYYVPTTMKEKKAKETSGMAEMQKDINRLSAEMKQVRQVLNETLVSITNMPLRSDSVVVKENQRR